MFDIRIIFVLSWNVGYYLHDDQIKTYRVDPCMGWLWLQDRAHNEGKLELNTFGKNCKAGRYKVGKGGCEAYIVLRRTPLRILRGTQ